MKTIVKPFVLCRVIPKYTNEESGSVKPILPMFNGILHRSKLIVGYTLGWYKKC